MKTTKQRFARFSACLIFIASFLCHTHARAAEPISPEHAKFFESEIRPLLLEHCVACHGPEKQKGELRLDTFGQLIHGGESGPAISPKKPNESLLIEAIRYESLEMPPDKKLSDKEIEKLVRWVEIGAPWPGDDDTPIKRQPKEKITDEDRAWWAFQPLAEPSIPAINFQDFPSDNPIDAFLRARMIGADLSPAPPADRVSLIRRVYFDLIGLPPTPEQVDAFLNDESPDAFAKLVDQLLDSPQYGERWARHWLDLVRYADSDGYRIDHYRPNAWRYRDYVVNSFNQDKPYYQFVQEQIAGDELFPEDTQALIATGFLRHWIYEYNNRDAKQHWTTIINDLTDTTGDVFLGMGMQCAKCHDHKFDPILQRDYFRLQAFFSSVIPRDETVASPEELAEYQEKMAVWEEKTADIRKQIDELEASYRKNAADRAVRIFPPDIQLVAKKPAEARTTYEQQIYELVRRQIEFEYDRIDSKFKGEDKEKIIALKKKLSDFDKFKPRALPVANVARDASNIPAPVTLPKAQRRTDLAGISDAV